MATPPIDPRVAVLAEMRTQTALLKQILTCLQTGIVSAVQTVAAAPAVSLDGPHGNPKLRFIPRDWTGSREYKGALFSECPPELLDLAADSLDYFAGKAEDEKKKKYDLLDAARARGWAARIRGGYVAPPLVTPEQEQEPKW